MRMCDSSDIFIGGTSGNTGDMTVNGGTLTLGGTYNAGAIVYITTGGTIYAASASTIFNVGTDLYIGYDVAGALRIANGATVNVPGTVHIAYNAGSTGTLNIGSAAADAQWGWVADLLDNKVEVG